MNQQKVCATEARELQIHVAGKSLSQAIDALQMVSSDLVRRAELALRPQPPDDTKGECDSRPIRCTLAQGIEDEADRVRAVTALLHNALERLEL